MWNAMKSWLSVGPSGRPLHRQQKVLAGATIEGLESRQLLSASGGGRGGAAQIAVDQGRAVPRINGVAGEYGFFNEPGTLTVTQDGQTIQGTISADHNPSGTFDAFFRRPNSKVAKGTGTFFFDNEEFSTPVKVKVKFIPLGGGEFDFRYRFREIR